jgi:hypothetical protein
MGNGLAGIFKPGLRLGIVLNQLCVFVALTEVSAPSSGEVNT